MQFFWVSNEHRYVRTQSEAERLNGQPTAATEIPTDKDGLLKHLNELQQRLWEAAQPRVAPEPPEALEEPVEENAGEPEAIPRPMGAIATLARMDLPNIDAVVEAIGQSKSYALARCAGAVAIRYQELENGKK